MGYSRGASSADLDPSLLVRIDKLCEDGWNRWERFDRTVRQRRFHPFVAADYFAVRDALVTLARPGRRFLEWGSATGVITILADLLGFDAYGIELDERLVREARELARNHAAGARFAVGSFLPAGYRWRGPSGDGRLGTIGQGPSGYLELGIPLDEFDVVFGYPWPGEDVIMIDLMRAYGAPDGLLLLHDENGVTVHGKGRPAPRPPSRPQATDCRR
jgi:hypothetical protein